MSEMYPVRVPEFIIHMTHEERQREIERLEAEARRQREELQTQEQRQREAVLV